MDIKLKSLLEEKKSSILSSWFDAIMESYPTDNTGLFKKQEDRFANPVGHTFNQGMESILEALVAEKELAESLPFLDDIIRVRTVQDFTPAKAVDFIFKLKKVVREALKKEVRQDRLDEALLNFESKIDDLALLAFNIYVTCRDQLNQLKVDELKRMTFTLLKKANLMSEIPMEEFERRDQEEPGI
ncbi:MAG TPA: RsbRD N-terminal domain-containing protein [Desulfosporosinus sp.]|nr:RsbRD N-terminal domain-containing protein [Desulfosporosinus sp.]